MRPQLQTAVFSSLYFVKTKVIEVTYFVIGLVLRCQGAGFQVSSLFGSDDAGLI
jgi:hypothetical protein